MKTIALLLSFFLFGCAAPKAFLTDPAVLQRHPRPFLIYEIGLWRPGYVVLNLIDAKGVHFNLVARDKGGFKEGAVCP